MPPQETLNAAPWVHTDEKGNTSVDAEKLTFAPASRDESSSLRKNLGAGGAGGNLNHRFRTRIDSTSGTNPFITVWGITDASTGQNTWGNSYNLRCQPPNFGYQLIRDISAAVTFDQTVLNPGGGVIQYIDVVISGGVITAFFYTDDSFGTEIENVTQSYTGETFQYLYAFACFDSNLASRQMSGITGFIDLNPGLVANANYYRQLIESNRRGRN